MADIPKMHRYALADGYLPVVHTEKLRQLLRIAFSALSCTKAGHGNGDNAFAAKAKHIEGADCHKQRKR